MQMKNSSLSAGKPRHWFTGIALVCAIFGSGCASAETYRQGGSTAIIQQSGGSGNSESQVTRYRDGQKIITRDGSSTDITIQRSGGFPPQRMEYPTIDGDRFDQRFGQERFPSIAPYERSGTDYAKEPSCGRDAFKQRMLDRMR